jgi:DNA polymerase-3 subunit delta
MSNFNKYANPKKSREPETLSPKIIDERIKSGKIGGIYYLFGDEEYMADYYIKQILEKFAGGEESGLDCGIFDADNFDAAEIRDMIASYPVMTDYKIIVIKNTEAIKFSASEEEMLVRTLSEYKDEIKDYACVAFKAAGLGFAPADNKNVSQPAAGAGPRPAKKTPGLTLANFLKSNAELFEFKINPPASLIKWLRKIAASENINLTDENAGYILDRHGRTEMKMYPLRNELDKLINYSKAENRAEITRKDIELLIAGKAELEAFELTNAILEKKYGKALESLEKLKNLKEEPGRILGQIARHFGDLLAVNIALSSGISDNAAVSVKTGLHEYKIKLTVNSLKRYADPPEFIDKSLELCRECDLRIKSTGLSDYTLIENLLLNIAEV